MSEYSWNDRISVALMFLGVIGTYIWLILKHFGYINTPWFIEAIPFAASALAILLFLYHACAFVAQLRPLPKQLAALTKRVDKIDAHLEHVDNDLEFLKKAVVR
jgi:ribosomal protein S15P/S13E